MSLRSAAKPRVRVAPQAVSSDADDACFLSSGYGLTPDTWQAEVIADWLGRRKDGKWAASRCGLAVPRQNGKNGVIEVRELFGMIALGEKFLHTAHEVKTARKAFLRIASFFENERRYPELAALVKDIRKTNGQEAVILANGGSVEFVARSKGSGRGFTVDVLVLDEAQDLKDEELEALKPTISAAPLGNPQTIMTGTPPDPEKGQSGEVFARFRRGAEKAKRTAWTDFGVTDGPMPDLDDRSLWRVTNPALGTRLQMDVIIDEREDLSDEGFARERLGWWGDPETAGAGVLDLAKWSTLKVEAPPPERATLVLDVSPDRRSSSIGLAARGPDDRTLVLTYTAGGMGWVVPRLVELVGKRDLIACDCHGAKVALHPSSQAGTLIPDLVDAGIEFHPLTTTEVGQACGAFIEGVTAGAYAHVGQPELDAAVSNAKTRFVSEAELWDRRKRDIDISPLVAVSTAAFRWGVLSNSGPAPLTGSLMA